MKTLLLLTISLSFSALASATELKNCELTYQSCTEATTCSAFHQCQRTEHALLNALILKAIDELSLEESAQCIEKRNRLEFSIEAHATTIECVDTVDGPQFGG